MSRHLSETLSIFLILSLFVGLVYLIPECPKKKAAREQMEQVQQTPKHEDDPYGWNNQ